MADRAASEYEVGTTLEFWSYCWNYGENVVRKTYTRLDNDGIEAECERGRGVSWKTRRAHSAMWLCLSYLLSGRCKYYQWLTDDGMDEDVLHRRHQTKEAVMQEYEKDVLRRLKSAEDEVEKQRVILTNLRSMMQPAPVESVA